MSRKYPHLDPRLFNAEDSGVSEDIDIGKDDSVGSGVLAHEPLTVSQDLHLPIELRRLVAKFGMHAKTIPTAEQFALIMLPFVDDGPQKPCETFEPTDCVSTGRP
jgi:hypothetical protein